jgi:hypothetical protein
MPDAPPAACTILLLACLTLGACNDAGEPAPSDAPTPARVQAAEAEARLSASEGGRLVLRAIEAHGGLEAWYGAPTSAYAWEYSNLSADLRFKSYMMADNGTRRVYHDLLELGTPDSTAAVRGRFAWDGTDAWISPDSIDRINPRFWATTGYYFESIPFVLADPGLRYDLLPPDTLDGRPYDMVKVSFDDGVGDSYGDTYTLYVNPETGLVDAIRYTVTYGRGRPAEDQPVRETLLAYEGYVTVDGLTVATHFRGFSFADGVKGAPRSEAWATDISFRKPFDASRLERPEGARIQPAPSP